MEYPHPTMNPTLTSLIFIGGIVVGILLSIVAAIVVGARNMLKNLAEDPYENTSVKYFDGTEKLNTYKVNFRQSMADAVKEAKNAPHLAQIIKKKTDEEELEDLLKP